MTKITLQLLIILILLVNSYLDLLVHESLLTGDWLMELVNGGRTLNSIMAKLKFSPVKTMEIYEDDPKYLLQLFVHIFNVIEEARKRKKRPSREVVLKAVCERHGLVDSVVSEALYLLIEWKSVYTKNDNKGNDFLFINTELRGK